MHKLLYALVLFASLLLSCNNKKGLLGKWRMTADPKSTLHFITDSTGSIESLQNSTVEPVRDFKYAVNKDTLVERSYGHIFSPRKWKIIKLDKDSLVIYNDGGVVSYYRVE